MIIQIYPLGQELIKRYRPPDQLLPIIPPRTNRLIRSHPPQTTIKQTLPPPDQLFQNIPSGQTD